MKTIICQNCGKSFQSQRKTRKFCSVSCANRSIWASSKTRECSLCGKSFPITSAKDANRKYCSQKCSKKANTKRVSSWMLEHPDAMKKYNQARVAKNPGAGKDKSRKDRKEIIKLLGEKCIVCGVSNQNWLHVDYIETTRNKPYRHPRHLKYIREHLSGFRLLCANHHYELTLTGKIEGTDITQ